MTLSPIAAWLVRLGITRDSIVWWYGKFVGFLVVLGALSAETAQRQYGIAPKWFHVIQVLGAWLMLISAQNSNSTLPGKKD